MRRRHRGANGGVRPHLEIPRTVTLEQAGEFYRAMNGDRKAQETVTIGDVGYLENAPTFERFLLWNKDRLVIYEREELKT